MVANSIEMEIEQALSVYLGGLTVDELKKTTRKQCRAYLEQKLNKSLSAQKKHIKSFLLQYITNYMKRNDIKTHKRKLSGCMDQKINNMNPLKKIKPSPDDNDYKENISEMTEITSLIEADNLISQLNEELNEKIIKNNNNNNNKLKQQCCYDNIEYEALKNKLTKCNDECFKYKQMAKEYASLLQPKIIECQDLKKQNEILNKNIQILENKHSEQIVSLKNSLKNESENVKEERFKYLRTQKYLQRVEKKFNFVCNKYNIDKDSVVIQMNHDI